MFGVKEILSAVFLFTASTLTRTRQHLAVLLCANLLRKQGKERKAVSFYHLCFHVQGEQGEKKKNADSAPTFLIDGDYVLQEDFNQTCWQPGCCFHFATFIAVCTLIHACVCAFTSGAGLMNPEQQLIMQIGFFYGRSSSCTWP